MNKIDKNLKKIVSKGEKSLTPCFLLSLILSIQLYIDILKNKSFILLENIWYNFKLEKNWHKLEKNCQKLEKNCQKLEKICQKLEKNWLKIRFFDARSDNQTPKRPRLTPGKISPS